MGSDRNNMFFSDFICQHCDRKDKKMLHTKCGHRFCDNCKSEMFAQKQSGVINCPFCDELLKRTDICEKSNLEIDFEAEVSIRNKLFKQFNETRDNFESEREYNDYLEFYEEIVNLKIKNSKDSFKNAGERQKSIEKEEREISEYQKQKNEREAKREETMKFKTIQNSRTKIDWNDILWPSKKLEINDEFHGTTKETNKNSREI